LWEFVFSISFWGINALAGADVIPNLQLLNVTWSFTPMMAASVLVYREDGKVGRKELFKRCFDYKRINSKIWYLPILLLERFIIFIQHGLALLLRVPAPAPQFTWLVPLAYIGFFIGVFG
jgi:hypothetical protein